MYFIYIFQVTPDGLALLTDEIFTTTSVHRRNVLLHSVFLVSVLVKACGLYLEKIHCKTEHMRLQFFLAREEGRVLGAIYSCTDTGFITCSFEQQWMVI